MQKIILLATVFATLAYAEVIDKDNILNQLKELQKAKSELTRDENSPEVLREKQTAEMKDQNGYKIAQLKKIISAFSSLVNDDIVIPRGKYSHTQISGKESFFVFEQVLETIIFQKKMLHQKGEKVKLLEKQIAGLRVSDSLAAIEKASADINALLNIDAGFSSMGTSMNGGGTQKPLVELRVGDLYGEYEVHNKNGALVLARFGVIK